MALSVPSGWTGVTCDAEASEPGVEACDDLDAMMDPPTKTRELLPTRHCTALWQ